MNKSKINKYKINNNNKTNIKHEFNVKYERYKQDNMRQVQPEMLPKNSNFSSCLQNIKFKNNTT